MNAGEKLAAAQRNYSRQLRKTTKQLDAFIAAMDAAHWRRWQAYWGRYVGGEAS